MFIHVFTRKDWDLPLLRFPQSYIGVRLPSMKRLRKMLVRHGTRTWKGSCDQVKIRALWFHLLISCHCHALRLGVLRDRLALVWHLLKQTWYLGFLITLQNKQYPRPKISLPPAHCLQIGVGEVFICFPIWAPCVSIFQHMFWTVFFRRYTRICTSMHQMKFLKGNTFDQQTPHFRNRRLLGSSFSHPTMLGSKDPDLLEFRRRSAGGNFRGQTYWLFSWPPIRKHIDYIVKECLGMPKIPVKIIVTALQSQICISRVQLYRSHSSCILYYSLWLLEHHPWTDTWTRSETSDDLLNGPSAAWQTTGNLQKRWFLSFCAVFRKVPTILDFPQHVESIQIGSMVVARPLGTIDGYKWSVFIFMLRDVVCMVWSFCRYYCYCIWFYMMKTQMIFFNLHFGVVC